ncbi:Prenyltransferase and squalene oxidase repeat protein [Phycisphaerae bacterium RAS2]|nr:Prenyltransferase and squalene oxidase repeat protein [Phycisphaerae bacterium RAS2]
MRRTLMLIAAASAGLLFTGLAPAWSSPQKSSGIAPPAPMPPIAPAVKQQTDATVSKALKFLAARQEKDGGWNAKYGPAVTAIVAKAFADSPDYGPNHAVVQRAVESILRHAQHDGGFYERQQNLANYQTSVVLTFLASLDRARHAPHIAKAQAFLKGLQYDESEKKDVKDTWYGGAGYNTTKRPDLSNTQMMLEALHQSGLSTDDPVYKRAIVFISRCQMNETTNDQPFARGASDGGFVYTAADGGESKATGGFELGRPLRSYGSMTYAGFKSYLYAGLSRDDPRVTAARTWIRQNYTLDVNPGMPDRQKREGLYYYYHVFSRALVAWGEPTITDGAGHSHDWRVELCRKVTSLQQPDGSWLNEADRWLEGDADYVTGLTVTTLQTAAGANSGGMRSAE